MFQEVVIIRLERYILLQEKIKCLNVKINEAITNNYVMISDGKWVYAEEYIDILKEEVVHLENELEELDRSFKVISIDILYEIYEHLINCRNDKLKMAKIELIINLINIVEEKEMVR